MIQNANRSRVTPKIANYNDDGVRNLMLAICLQAVEDYNKSTVKVEKTGDIDAKNRQLSARRFILSQTFCDYCGIDGRKAITALNRQIESRLQKGGKSCD